MTTSQKHQSFISEPMGEKPVTELAGIGEVLGKRLSAKGYDRVCSFCLLSNNFFYILCFKSTLGLCCSWTVLGFEKRRRVIR